MARMIENGAIILDLTTQNGACQDFFIAGQKAKKNLPAKYTRPPGVTKETTRAGQRRPIGTQRHQRSTQETRRSSIQKMKKNVNHNSRKSSARIPQTQPQGLQHNNSVCRRDLPEESIGQQLPADSWRQHWRSLDIYVYIFIYTYVLSSRIYKAI